MPGAPKISAILLVAGRSTRFGSNKLLMPLGGMPVVRRAALSLVESKAAEVIAVTGHQAAEVERAMENLNLRLTHNPAFESGQATSLIAGLNEAAGDAEGYLFALGDQPLIGQLVIDRLIDAFAASGGKALAAAPYFEGRRGNPVLLSSALREELASLKGDEGARGILRTLQAESPDRLAPVEVDGEEIFWDLDTAEDFEKLQSKFNGAE